MNPTRLTHSAWLLVILACLALTACGAAGAVVDVTPFPTLTAAPTDAATSTPEPSDATAETTPADAPPAETPAPDVTNTRRPTATRPSVDTPCLLYTSPSPRD